MNDLNSIMVAIKCITYNHEPYIRECLDGFVMQKTNFKFVAIVHDDASTDGTATIIKEYAEKYPEIIKPIYETENQYSKKDGSLQRIMNDAIEATGAKYVATCEGDDYWIDPYKLQKQVDFMENYPDYSMCYNATKWLWNDNSYSNNPDFVSHEDVDITTNQIISNGGLYINTVSILYRNIKTLNEMKKREWWRIADVGDYPLCIALSLVGKVRYLSDVMSVYRFQHIGSWTYSQKKTNINHIETEIRWMQILDKDTNRKYHKAIQLHLFPKFYRALYINHLMSTFKYIYLYIDSGRPISIFRLVKDIIRCHIIK